MRYRGIEDVEEWCTHHFFSCHFLLVQKVTKKDPANGHPSLAECSLIKRLCYCRFNKSIRMYTLSSGVLVIEVRIMFIGSGLEEVFDEVFVDAGEEGEFFDGDEFVF
jgi:hypothetical protein